MTLQEFIQNTLTAYNLEYKVEDVSKYLYDKAREIREGKSVVAVDDETVKEWIINYDPAALEAKRKEKAQKHATEQMEVAITNKEIETKRKGLEEQRKAKVEKEDKDYEQIDMFSFL